MAEYIDREKMLKYLEENNTADEWIVGQYNADWIYSFIESQPTADVVEVVRCKDCDVPHNKWTGCPHLNGLIPPPNHYCACGTPKERGGEK
jgi:hypothetical protein